MNRRDFFRSAGTGALGMMLARSAGAAEGGRLSGLSGAGERFSFGVCADPQVGHADDPNPVASNARRTLRLAVDELNRRDSPPLFTVFLGDLVNVFDDASVANFEDCIAGLKSQAVLVHGNHDTRPPYDGFKALMGRVCGFQDLWWSFDAGRWHFVVLPCNLGHGGAAAEAAEKEMLAWLERDLADNAARPTMVFEHFHALPQGLTQLEWYNFPMDLRVRIMSLLTRHGNVRWYFNGHVHNGLKASVKTSWRYRGINFINAPTIIQSRNFGEEYGGFVSGLETGGYYLVVEVDGEQVRLTGRLAGLDRDWAYPDTFTEFRDELEPRWFTRGAALPASAALVNGDFSDGLKGWSACYRYKADVSPGFGWEAEEKGGRAAARLFTRTVEPVFWANDELTEIYQTVAAPQGGTLLRTAYYLGKVPDNGGGYIRLSAMRGDEFVCSVMFRWGVRFERDADILVRQFAYGWHGKALGWKHLQELGEQRKGLFLALPETPGRWHELEADIPALYNQAVGRADAFAGLGVTKYTVSLGTWVTSARDAESTAWFGGAALEGAGGGMTAVNGAPLPVDGSVFKTDFGRALAERVEKQEARKAKRKGG